MANSLEHRLFTLVFKQRSLIMHLQKRKTLGGAVALTLALGSPLASAETMAHPCAPSQKTAAHGQSMPLSKAQPGSTAATASQHPCQSANCGAAKARK